MEIPSFEESVDSVMNQSKLVVFNQNMMKSVDIKVGIDRNRQELADSILILIDSKTTIARLQQIQQYLLDYLA